MRRRILNNRAQPVELHLTGGVVVIPPSGEAVLEVDEAAERHLEYLASELRVTIMPVAEQGGAETEKPEPHTLHREGSKKTAAKRKR